MRGRNPTSICSWCQHHWQPQQGKDVTLAVSHWLTARAIFTGVGCCMDDYWQEELLEVVVMPCPRRQRVCRFAAVLEVFNSLGPRFSIIVQHLALLGLGKYN